MEEYELLARISDGKRLLSMFEEVHTAYKYASSRWESDPYKGAFARVREIIQKEIDLNRLKLCALRGE